MYRCLNDGGPTYLYILHVLYINQVLYAANRANLRQTAAIRLLQRGKVVKREMPHR